MTRRRRFFLVEARARPALDEKGRCPVLIGRSWGRWMHCHLKTVLCPLERADGFGRKGIVLDTLGGISDRHLTGGNG